MLKFSNDPNIAEQQMCAIIFYLTAFGYIDGDFDLSEKTYVRLYIRKLVEQRALDAMPDARPEMRAEVVDRFVTHFHEVFESINRDIKALFSEAVADGERVEEFVLAKLKLRSYEIFRSFDSRNQKALLATVDELINADGTVHPAEAKFRDEVTGLLKSAVPPPMPLAKKSRQQPRRTSELQLGQPKSIQARLDNHPFFIEFEEHYSADPVRIRKQAEADYDLIMRTMAKLDEQRQASKTKLEGAQDIAEFDGKEPFLDGHIYVHPSRPGKRYDITVLGDLHGCYSCLKGAVLQSEFFAKLEAFRLNPQHQPEPKLVFLGDYIDRGHYSYNGVLRSVMQLFSTAPDNVYMLRGNHEYYIEYGGRVYGGVKPAEAINTLVGYMPNEMFEAYMKLFEQLPNVLIFDHFFFVHAGIPRDATLAAKWRDLSSLNDPEIRFQMLWSDPSQADYIPLELQAQNARFPFGRRQFERFMERVGCSTLVRGHEKIEEGFRSVYPGEDYLLLNVFSAGGHNNRDLPEDSSYRDVTPMALSIHVDDEASTIIPWEIDYQRYNHPTRNAFFASPPEIRHKK